MVWFGMDGVNCLVPILFPLVIMLLIDGSALLMTY